MRFAKFFAALAVWAISGSAVAAPVFTPFLKLDLNGDSGGGPGPTQTDLGYTGFNLANTPAGPTLSTTVGANTVTFTSAANSTGYLSRNRGAFTPGTVSPLYQDFLGSGRNASFGLGSNAIQIQVSGLTPSTQYEFTGFGFDSFSTGSGLGQNREMFGTTAPPAGGYLPGSPPAFNAATPFWAAGNPAGEYDYSASFNVTSDAAGVITVFAWGDTADFSGQTATILNGIAVGATPEPGGFGVIAVSAVGLMVRRRRQA